MEQHRYVIKFLPNKYAPISKKEVTFTSVVSLTSFVLGRLIYDIKVLLSDLKEYDMYDHKKLIKVTHKHNNVKDRIKYLKYNNAKINRLLGGK